MGGFGDVAEARLCYNKMAAGMARLREIEQNVEHDAVNSEKYIKELSKVCWDMSRATGAMFEQEHLRFINMFTAAGGGGNGGGYRHPKAVMENKVIQTLRAEMETSPCSGSGTSSSPRHYGKLEVSARR